MRFVWTLMFLLDSRFLGNYRVGMGNNLFTKKHPRRALSQAGVSFKQLYLFLELLCYGWVPRSNSILRQSPHVVSGTEPVRGVGVQLPYTGLALCGR